MTSTAIIGAAVSVFGAIVSLTYGLISIRAQALKEVGELYDQMVGFRVEHPEVLRLSRQWKPSRFGKVYGQKSDSDRQWVTYYSYVELCLGYCNTVLSSRRRLSRASYEHHHRLLVKLILTEHYPIVEDLLRGGKYVSPHVREFRDGLAAEGWDWAEEHRLLAE